MYKMSALHSVLMAKVAGCCSTMGKTSESSERCHLFIVQWNVRISFSMSGRDPLRKGQPHAIFVAPKMNFPIAGH